MSRRPAASSTDIRGSLRTQAINGTPTGFTVEARPIESVVGKRHPTLAHTWSAAFAFRGAGGLLASVAAGMASQTFAIATDGVLYDAENGPFREWHLLRQGVDLVLSTEFKRPDLYESRSPAPAGSRPTGPATISSRLFDQSASPPKN